MKNTETSRKTYQSTVIHGLTPTDLVRLNGALESQGPIDILRWTLHRLGHLRIGMTSAFGAEGCVLVDMVRQQRKDVPVYTIDTGLLFEESVAVREAYRALGANVVVLEPLVSLRRQADVHGPRLYERDPDRCCELRKVEPMLRILDQVDVWLTAIRRDQGQSRQSVPILGVARRRDGTAVLKVAPLARYTRTETWRYLLQRELPYNPLLDQGYPSVGCRPCTRPAQPGQGERTGRWQGHAKTECGIHNL